MGVAGMFGLLNAGLTIANGLKSTSSTTSESSLDGYGLNELGAYLEGGDASEEALSAAESFLKDNPFMQALFPDTQQMREDGAKVDAFEKETKMQEFLQAKEMADAKINSSQESYYDKELSRKLEAFRKDIDKSDPDYEVKKEKVLDDHKQWMRKKRTGFT